jgi:MFS family permease
MNAAKNPIHPGVLHEGESPMDRPTAHRSARRREGLRLAVVFGSLYFAYAISDPTAGLVSQPDLSLLRTWGENPQRIGMFAALLAGPWCLKPIFGLISDLIPLAGYYRKSYLFLASLLAIGGFAGLTLWPPSFGAELQLFGWLLIPTFGLAFADVVTTALMIETGQPLGITGRLQSAQWAASYAGTILTGTLGGILSEYHLQRLGFLVCGVLLIAALGLPMCSLRERPDRVRHPTWKRAVGSLGPTLRSPEVLAVALLLFAWHFNPFSHAVLYLHMTDGLKFHEQIYGTSLSLFAVGSMLACIGYGLRGTKLPMRGLVYVAVGGGCLSTLAYWSLATPAAAMLVSLVVGFLYMTCEMILVDLAARACPIHAPGTVFALFMALCNVSSLLATCLGGYLYQLGSTHWGAPTAFNALLLLSACCTAACLPLLKLLPDSLLGAPPPAITPEVATDMLPLA